MTTEDELELELELDNSEPANSSDDEIEAEMEGLIEEAAKEDEPDLANELSDLDDLLNEAMAERKDAQSVAEARKKAKGGYALSSDDLARIKAWELAREWLPVANVALFHRYECACGKHNTVYEGLLLEQKHRHNSTANRWTSQEEPASRLPKKTAVRTTSVPFCPVCSEAKGWKISNELEW